MSALDQRLKRVEDRMALQDLILDYIAAVDGLSDPRRIERILACFADSAIFDLQGLGSKRFEGHVQIREFFVRHQPDPITHLVHHLTHFQLLRLEQNEADVRGYVLGAWMTRSGSRSAGHVYYDLSCERTDGHWRIRSLVEGALLPLAQSETEET